MAIIYKGVKYGSQKLSKSDTIRFGKHKGDTYDYILHTDASYILWLDENEVIDIPEEWVEEAIELAAAQRRDYLNYMYGDEGDDPWDMYFQPH